MKQSKTLKSLFIFAIFAIAANLSIIKRRKWIDIPDFTGYDEVLSPLIEHSFPPTSLMEQEFSPSIEHYFSPTPLTEHNVSPTHEVVVTYNDEISPQTNSTPSLPIALQPINYGKCCTLKLDPDQRPVSSCTGVCLSERACEDEL